MTNLAIIIPYYKIKFFEATLQSLADQTDQRFKVYIGDDASTENTGDLLKIFEKKFDFFYHRFDNNLGGISLVNQWERCIELANNEDWIMILGDDDVLDKNVVENFYLNLKFIIENNFKTVRFSTVLINQNSIEISPIFLHPTIEKATDSFFRKMIGKTRSSLSEYIFSKSVFGEKKFKNYPLAWYSDDMAWLDFSVQNQIFSINEVVLYIRISAQSISGSTENIAEKKIAFQQFYNDLFANKFTLFKVYQRLIILYNWEQKIKTYRNLSLKEWFFLLNLYLKNFRIKPFIKFSRRFFLGLKSLLRHE